MERKNIPITNHEGTNIFEVIIPDNNSATSAELLSGQIGGKVVCFYDDFEDRVIYGVLVSVGGKE